jgi:16S rRNA processing protein RimM
MKQDDFLLIGKVVSVHGVHGNLKVYSFAESSSAFQPDDRVLVRDKSGHEKERAVRQVKPHKRNILLSLRGIENCDDAKALVGAEIFIRKSKLPELDDGTYYWFEIIGLEVLTIDNRYLGCVESIIATGGNDVYVVKGPGEDSEILIPALETVVDKIDLDAKTMWVNLPEGLELSEDLNSGAKP